MRKLIAILSVLAIVMVMGFPTKAANDWQYASNAGDSSTSVFFQAPPNSKTTVMHAHHTASNGNQTWEADTDTTHEYINNRGLSLRARLQIYPMCYLMIDGWNSKVLIGIVYSGRETTCGKTFMQKGNGKITQKYGF